MKPAKIIILVLCAALIAAAITSSDFNNTGFDAGPRFISSAPKTHSIDTVMLSTDENLTITWDIFYYILYNSVGQLTYGFQDQLDWNEISHTGESWAEYLKSYVVDQLIDCLVYDYGIHITDTSLTDDETADMLMRIDMMADEAGSTRALEQSLLYEGIINIKAFERLMLYFTLQDKLPSSLYGESYDSISDDTVRDFAEREGYMQAKHILLSFPSELDGYTSDEAESEKAIQKGKAEEILAGLNARKNDDDFTDYFSSLIEEYSDDPGSFSYPDGYLFTFYDMVEPFSSACSQLMPGQISGIVETAYGFHIILRLPLDYDNTVPVSAANSGQAFSLRQLAVFDDFDNKLSEWRERLVITQSPQLESLNIADLFSWD